MMAYAGDSAQKGYLSQASSIFSRCGTDYCAVQGGSNF